ncbi:MAG: dipeptide ABC transporter ATP-binding protein [Rhodospirillaceae bacterium]|nr:dipeptide ABC transporter ATP-binding protein [Rhodospirillaceae bacterium]
MSSGFLNSPPAKPILSVRDLKVHFRIGKKMFSKEPKAVLKAVDGVSFELGSGETLGLVGESGCGKSTLGRAVLRLLPNVQGDVVWKGQNLVTLPPEEVRKKRQELQIIFQDPLASLNPRMTVGEIIAEPLRTFQPDLDRTTARKIVQDMMAKMGLLPSQINRYPHEFSGGQCQRIGIARAMVNNPQLIVCDEPVSALDVSIQAQIVNLLMDLQREKRLSLIFISHNLSVVRHISHRIMVLYLGKVVELTDRDRLYVNPRHPYTKALISAVPLPDPNKEQNKKQLVISGELPSPLNPPSGCTFRTRCPLATSVCAEKIPPLEQIEPNHWVACHHWDQV